jgi:hypothetical protein
LTLKTFTLFFAAFPLFFGLLSCKKPENATEPALPVISLNQITDITFESAICRGAVTSQGSGSLIQMGVCWSEKPVPVLSGFHKDVVNPATGNFNDYIYDLDPYTTYYVRAYAANSVGIAYSQELSFISYSGFKSGQPWTLITPTVSFTSLSGFAGKALFAKLADNSNVRSGDGLTWTSAPDNLWYLEKSILRITGNDLYLSDDGENWTSIGRPPQSQYLNVIGQTKNYLFLAYENKLSRTSDNGVTWAEVTGPWKSYYGQPRGLTVSNVLFIWSIDGSANVNSNRNRYYKSEDEGATWTRINQFPFGAIPGEADVIYSINNGQGQGPLYASFDKGTTFPVLSIPNLKGMIIYNKSFYGIDPGNDIVASIDGGRTWSPFMEGLDKPQGKASYIGLLNGTLYCLSGNFLFKRKL